VNLLAALSDAQILQIAELMEDRLFKANEIVFRKGDKADAFYVSAPMCLRSSAPPSLSV
jgi:CRP-like cAMP-binding protein